MASPTLDLQEMMVAKLKSDLADLVGARVFDAVPESATYPYVSLGPVTELQDDVDCVDGSEVSIQWDTWAVGSPEASLIADALKRALHRADENLGTNALVSIEHVRTTRLRDPDGPTHCAVEFRAIVETP